MGSVKDPFGFVFNHERRNDYGPIQSDDRSS